MKRTIISAILIIAVAAAATAQAFRPIPNPPVTSLETTLRAAGNSNIFLGLLERVDLKSLGVAVAAATQEPRPLSGLPAGGGGKIQRPGGMSAPRIDPKTAAQAKVPAGLPAKTPVAFVRDEALGVSAVRLADGSTVPLLPRVDVLQAQATRNRMLLLPEQQRLRRLVLSDILSRPRPAVFDNMAVQTRVQNQGGRSTCAVFAATAALEAAYKRSAGRDIDLSEEYTNWLKNVVWMSDGDNPAAPSQTDASKHENLPGSVSAGVSCVGILQMLTTTTPEVFVAPLSDLEFSAQRR